mmetsp:Transcript_149591/g.480090  ORF Transcript_149591/g.480090 Transcript_149591/m.480090 type:complete len:425 (+) Transcript_149591:9421-10695(+)
MGLADGVAFQLLDQRHRSLERGDDLLELVERRQLAYLLRLLGHLTHELVKVLSALGQCTNVELGPQPIAEVVDHGAVVEVNLVDLLEQTEVLLELQQLRVRLHRQVEQRLGLDQLLPSLLVLPNIDVVLLHELRALLQLDVRGAGALVLELLGQLLAILAELRDLLLRDVREPLLDLDHSSVFGQGLLLEGCPLQRQVVRIVELLLVVGAIVERQRSVALAHVLHPQLHVHGHGQNLGDDAKDVLELVQGIRRLSDLVSKIFHLGLDLREILVGELPKDVAIVRDPAHGLLTDRRQNSRGVDAHETDVLLGLELGEVVGETLVYANVHVEVDKWRPPVLDLLQLLLARPELPAVVVALPAAQELVDDGEDLLDAALDVHRHLDQGGVVLDVAVEGEQLLLVLLVLGLVGHGPARAVHPADEGMR